MILLLYILSILTACCFGILEGLLFCGYVKDKHISTYWLERTGKDIHAFLTLFRFLVYIPFFIIILSKFNWVEATLFALAIMAMFPFWHDGMYYLTRSKLDGSYNGFNDVSETTSANTSMTFKERIVAFGLSILLLIFSLIL